jgi:ParD-like antitoxin of type II ParDE toxin-antitoxin system
MGMPVKLSDALVKLARTEADAADRSITAQIEHWAKLGRSVETALRHEDALALKHAGGDLHRVFPGDSTREAVHSVLRRIATTADRSLLRSVRHAAAFADERQFGRRGPWLAEIRSRTRNTDDGQPVSFGAQGERNIVRRHRQVHLRHFFPEQGRREVDGVQRTEFGRHRLGRPVQNDRIDLDKFERTDQRQNRRAMARDLHVGQIRAQSKSIQGPQTLGQHQGTRHALLDLSPFGQCVRLP